ncbi:hypothetical protein C8R44DRAFT_886016 [Mycena epipterygia]|nr:hypothetical protein C8R44DRAFT_886016 [Mycena epipterygia]
MSSLSTGFHLTSIEHWTSSVVQRTPVDAHWTLGLHLLDIVSKSNEIQCHLRDKCPVESHEHGTKVHCAPLDDLAHAGGPRWESDIFPPYSSGKLTEIHWISPGIRVLFPREVLVIHALPVVVPHAMLSTRHNRALICLAPSSSRFAIPPRTVYRAPPGRLFVAHTGFSHIAFQPFEKRYGDAGIFPQLVRSSRGCWGVLVSCDVL